MPMQNESTVVRSKKGHYLRHEKMIDENIVLSYFAAFNIYIYICGIVINSLKRLFSIMSHIQTHYHFKLDFHIVDQSEGKWLIW